MLKRTLKKLVRPVVVAGGRPFAAALAGRPPKRLSAMLRVKNEEEYLAPAIESIIDLVDEVVVIDNGSEDGSPQIIADFCRRYPSKVKSFSYPHRIARYGDEHVDLAKTRAGRRSPAFLPNYYNWCRDRCTEPYILKWDGDTVATEALAPTLRAFRQSRAQILWYTGINLHESGEHFISGRPLEIVEPRLFYKRFSHYENFLGFVEQLWSPYATLFTEYSEYVQEPLYFHLKFCKRERFSNMSADLQAREQRVSAQGEVLPADLRRQAVSLGFSRTPPLTARSLARR
jgi:glycosyltransferase involved in cell wall biosynthesis